MVGSGSVLSTYDGERSTGALVRVPGLPEPPPAAAFTAPTETLRVWGAPSSGGGATDPVQCEFFPWVWLNGLRRVSAKPERLESSSEASS